MYPKRAKRDQPSRCAYFLGNQGFKRQALQLSTDTYNRFDLASQTYELYIALELDYCSK